MDWESDRSTMLLLQQALILSRIDYGAIAYSSARLAVLKLLDSINIIME